MVWPVRLAAPLVHVWAIPLIILAAIISIACVAMDAFFPKELFSFLLNASGALMIFVYIGVAASQIILRPRTPQEKLHIKAWFHPWGGYLTIFAMLAVLVAMTLKDGSRTELTASLILLGAIVAAYYLFRRGRA